MSTPGRLELGKDGRVTGPASITWNEPWPCPNGSAGKGAATMLGVVMHTMDGSYDGTVSWFNKVDEHGNPVAQASAFFGISNDGKIHQFGPVGHNWMAWGQASGNPDWYSIEHEDDQHVSQPLTEEQIKASAQLVEFLSRYANFPLKVTDSVYDPGYGEHSMGGVPWGDHPDCPGPVRAAQRAEIVSLAKEIRVGVKDVPPPAPPPPAEPWQDRALTLITELSDLIRQHQ